MRTIKINQKLLVLSLILSSFTLNAGKTTSTYTIKKSTSTNIKNTANSNINKINNQNNETNNEIIIPKGLKPGDTIGLIAPANYANENRAAEIE